MLAASIATRLDLPYLSYAGHIEPDRRTAPACASTA